jgi:hypothetical protein
MTRQRKVLVGGIALLVALSACFVPWQNLITRVWLWNLLRSARQRQVRLLYRTDHRALLEACRGISRSVLAGNLKPGQYHIGAEQNRIQLPSIILQLQPTYVWLGSDGAVVLEMLGGLDHFGVRAYPEAFQPPPGYSLGDKELVEGLWYYDDEYRHDPNYEEKLEAIRPKT